MAGESVPEPFSSSRGPETGLGETNCDLLEADFWMASGTKTRESAVWKAQAFITVQAGARHSGLAFIQESHRVSGYPVAVASWSAQNHVSVLGVPLVTENVLVQELVAELPALVVLPA